MSLIACTPSLTASLSTVPNSKLFPSKIMLSKFAVYRLHLEDLSFYPLTARSEDDSVVSQLNCDSGGRFHINLQ